MSPSATQRPGGDRVLRRKKPFCTVDISASKPLLATNSRKAMKGYSASSLDQLVISAASASTDHRTKKSSYAICEGAFLMGSSVDFLPPSHKNAEHPSYSRSAVNKLKRVFASKAKVSAPLQISRPTNFVHIDGSTATTEIEKSRLPNSEASQLFPIAPKSDVWNGAHCLHPALISHLTNLGRKILVTVTPPEEERKLVDEMPQQKSREVRNPSELLDPGILWHRAYEKDHEVCACLRNEITNHRTENAELQRQVEYFKIESLNQRFEATKQRNRADAAEQTIVRLEENNTRRKEVEDSRNQQRGLECQVSNLKQTLHELLASPQRGNCRPRGIHIDVHELASLDSETALEPPRSSRDYLESHIPKPLCLPNRTNKTVSQIPDTPPGTNSKVQSVLQQTLLFPPSPTEITLENFEPEQQLPEGRPYRFGSRRVEAAPVLRRVPFSVLNIAQEADESAGYRLSSWEWASIPDLRLWEPNGTESEGS